MTQILVASALAAEPAATVSSKYGFFDTRPLVQEVESMGYLLTRQTEARTRIEERKGKTKHVLTFQPGKDILSRETRKIGDSIPEIKIVNSHDGGSSLQIRAGLHRLVCLNGLTVGGDQFDIRYPHRAGGHSLDDILGDIGLIGSRFSQVAEHVGAMQARTLTKDDMERFAAEAASLRWEEGKEQASPRDLLYARRYSDGGSDVWSVFNRVQENLIKGGIRGTSADNKRRKIRKVTSLDDDLKINAELWSMATALVA